MPVRLTTDDATTFAIAALRNSDSIWQELEERQAAINAWLHDVLSRKTDVAQMVADAFGVPLKTMLSPSPLGAREKHGPQCAFVALMAKRGLSLQRAQEELPGATPQDLASMLASHSRWMADPSQTMYHSIYRKLENDAPRNI